METQSRQAKQERNSEIISCLSNNQSFFRVYPFTKLEASDSRELNLEVPDVLVFKNRNDLRIKDLVKIYQKQFGRKIQTFQLRSHNYCFKPSQTIMDIKRRLMKQNIEGQFFYICDDYVFWNECCMQSVMFNEKKLQMKARKIHFQIQPIGYSVYVGCQDYQEVGKIKRKLAIEIARIWGMKIPIECLGLETQNIKNVLETEKVLVKIKGIQLCLPKENKAFLIVKRSEYAVFQIQTKRFQYSAIESKKVIDLLMKLDEQRNWTQFGLKIGDIVIKSNQIISQKCKVLFQKSQINIKNLVAVVIKQIHIFQAEKAKIEKKGVLELSSIVLPTQQNEKLRLKCQQQIQRRAKQTSHSYFKGNFKNVEPILLYTSELKVKPSSGKREAAIYRVVNEFLRGQNFACSSESDYSKWQYIFQCILLNKLSELDPLPPDPAGKNAQSLKKGWTNRTLWRGQSFAHDFQENEIVLFKQFISTTEKESVAKAFASRCIFKIVKSKSGRLIIEYSLIREEAEVLFSSYTSFKVLKKYEIFDEKRKKDILCYEMEELETQLPSPSIVNLILWVDDKTAEGKKMWDELSIFEHSTVMHQLVSTEQLEKWLTMSKEAIRDSSELANVVMISNMTRKENNKINELAGVEAIQVFRTCFPHGNIFLYIGNRKLALQKLQKNGIKPSEELQVSSVPDQLKKFLKNNLKIL